MRDARWLAIGARSVSLLSWLVVVAVMLRVLSGGGTLVGVGYVLSTESPVLLAFVAATFLVAAAAIISIARDHAGAWTNAWKRALLALTGAVVLWIAGHESAVFAIAAASLASVVAVVMALRESREP